VHFVILWRPIIHSCAILQGWRVQLWDTWFLACFLTPVLLTSFEHTLQHGVFTDTPHAQL